MYVNAAELKQTFEGMIANFSKAEAGKTGTKPETKAKTAEEQKQEQMAAMYGRTGPKVSEIDPVNLQREYNPNEIMTPQEKQQMLDRAKEITSEKGKVVEVIYLHRGDAAGGHADIMFVFEDGSATLYAYGADTNNIGKVLDMAAGKNITGMTAKQDFSPGELKDFMSSNPKTSGQTAYMMDPGEGNRIEGISSTKLDPRQYTAYRRFPVKSESQGLSMLARAENIQVNPAKYNLYKNNCFYATQQVLEAGGLNFWYTYGSGKEIITPNAVFERSLDWTGFDRDVTVDNFANQQLRQSDLLNSILPCYRPGYDCR
jgi:hypothetical protein